jgi:hypothetical protein
VKEISKWWIALPVLVVVVMFAFWSNQIQNSDELTVGQGMIQGNTVANGVGNVQSNMFNSNNCVGDQCLSVNNLVYPVGSLSDEAKTALTLAINDEYKAHAVYQAAIDKFGNQRPFIMVIRAEEQHISSLKALFDKYGIAVPKDETTNLPELTTLAGACSIGVTAEIENADLYKKELLPQVSQYEDIKLVFDNLMNASLQKHLPSFQKCAGI